MAVAVQHQGYQCEFIDTISDDFYCNKCSLVARKLTITSCCGQSYCQACIADTQQQAKPCPECGEKNFTTLQQIKYQQRMADLKVYCSTKRRGCGWSGTLEQLDAHLNSDLDNCQYMDTICPLNCDQIVPKNRVEQHVAEECVKRCYVCQHCAFKANYEVVVEIHWPECIYFPLECPNLCGVTCERGFMEDHKSMCPLEEVDCEFIGVGCNGKFRREEQEEHARQNTHKHLTTLSAAAVQMNMQLLQKIEEQKQKIIEQENIILQQKKKNEQNDQKIQQQAQKLEIVQEQVKKKFEEMELKFYKLLQETTHLNKAALKEVTTLNRTFVMQSFYKEKEKDKVYDWKSPAMYTRVWVQVLYWHRC